LPPFPVFLAALPVEAGCKGKQCFCVFKSAAHFIFVLFLVQRRLPVEAGGKGNTFFSSLTSQQRNFFFDSLAEAGCKDK
jgi:hypothetical protein